MTKIAIQDKIVNEERIRKSLD